MTPAIFAGYFRLMELLDLLGIKRNPGTLYFEFHINLKKDLLDHTVPPPDLNGETHSDNDIAKLKKYQFGM